MGVQLHRIKILLLPAALVFIAGMAFACLLLLGLGFVGKGLPGFFEEDFTRIDKAAVASAEGVVAGQVQQARRITSTRILLFDFASYGGAQARTGNLGRVLGEYVRESEELLGVRWTHAESGQSFAVGTTIDPREFGWRRNDGEGVFGPANYNDQESVLVVNNIVGVSGRTLGEAFYLFDTRAYQELVRGGVAGEPRVKLGINHVETGMPLFTDDLTLGQESRAAYQREVRLEGTPWNLHIAISEQASWVARFFATLTIQSLLSMVGMFLGFLLVIGFVGRVVLLRLSHSLSEVSASVSDRELVELQVVKQQFKEALFNLRQVVERIGGINEIICEESAPSETRRYASMVREEIEGLRDLIMVHGQFTKSDFEKVSQVVFSPQELLISCAEHLELKASGLQLELVCKGYNSLPRQMRGNETILRQCLLSAMECTLQHAKRRTEVIVHTESSGNSVLYRFKCKPVIKASLQASRRDFAESVDRLGVIVEYLHGSSEYVYEQDQLILEISIPMEIVEEASRNPLDEGREEIVQMVEFLIENPMSVLVVEDVVLNSTLLKRMLEKWNCRVIVASDGSEAVDEYRRYSEFDLILMDLEMPNVNGIEATRRIRSMEKIEKIREVPIVALTGHSDEGHEKACKEVGMNGYLTKPVNGKHLGRLLYELKRRCIQTSGNFQ